MSEMGILYYHSDDAMTFGFAVTLSARLLSGSDSPHPIIMRKSPQPMFVYLLFV
jgi:hypothetical protein